MSLDWLKAALIGQELRRHGGTDARPPHRITAKAGRQPIGTLHEPECEQHLIPHARAVYCPIEIDTPEQKHTTTAPC